MRDKVRNLERERQTQLILAPHNAYGFKLNINHPLIRPKWDAFKSANGLGQYGMTDDLRREFEETVLASKYMQKCLEQEQQRIGAGRDQHNGSVQNRSCMPGSDQPGYRGRYGH